MHIKVGSTRGVMAKVLDFGLEVSKFELQSRYDVHFRPNIFGKGTNLKKLTTS